MLRQQITQTSISRTYSFTCFQFPGSSIVSLRKSICICQTKTNTKSTEALTVLMSEKIHDIESVYIFFFNLPLILIWSRILNSNISIVITLESSNETSNPYKKKKACTCFFFFSVASSNETSISLDISKNACFLNSNAEFQGMLTSSCRCRRRNCGVCRSV